MNTPITSSPITSTPKCIYAESLYDIDLCSINDKLCLLESEPTCTMREPANPAKGPSTPYLLKQTLDNARCL